MNRQATVNIQDTFLNTARKNAIPLTIIVTNGYQIRDAVIKGYDSFVILVETEGKQQLIYKHAISSILPERAIELNGDKTRIDEK